MARSSAAEALLRFAKIGAAGEASRASGIDAARSAAAYPRDPVHWRAGAK